MGPQDDYIETVLTCEGDYYDPDFPSRLETFKQNLEGLLLKDEKPIILKKVEPWNSVRVTINIPKEAALRLKQLAETRDPSLRDIGILAVQIEGDNVISLTLAGKNNEKTELVFRTSDGPQPSTSFGFQGLSPPVAGPSAFSAGKDILQLLGQVQRSCSSSSPFSQPNPGMVTFKAPIAARADSFPPALRGPVPAASTSSNIITSLGSSLSGLPKSTASQAQLFPAPALNRNVGNPKGPKLPHFPLSSQGPFQNLQPPPPYPSGATVNNVPHSMMLNKDAVGGIPTSSQLLVTLLQNELAAAGGVGGSSSSSSHVNNFPIKKTQLPSPVKERPKEKELEAESSPQPKRRRKPKPKDGTKPPPRQPTKVDSATRDQFIAHMDDIFSDVIGDVGSDSEDVPSSSVPTPSTSAPSPQNVPLPSTSSVNTVMESNLPGFEPKTKIGDMDSSNRAINVPFNSNCISKINESKSAASGSDILNGHNLQRGVQDGTSKNITNDTPSQDSIESMIINPYTGQLEPIDSIEDGTIVSEDDKSPVKTMLNSKVDSSVSNSVSSKAALIDVKSNVDNSVQHKLYVNPSVSVTAADDLSHNVHVPPLSTIATSVVVSLPSTESKMPISSFLMTNASFSPSLASSVPISSMSVQVALSSSHPPTSLSCVSHVGHMHPVVDKDSVQCGAPLSDKLNEQRTNILAPTTGATGYNPQVGGYVSQKFDVKSDNILPPTSVPDVGTSATNIVKSASGIPTSPRMSYQLSKSPSPACQVKSPAHLNHDSDLSCHSIDEHANKDNSNMPSNSKNSRGSSPYATSNYSSSRDNSTTHPQIVTVGCVLNQQPEIIVSTHSMLLVPNLSKHEHRSVQSTIPIVTSTDHVNHPSENVRNSEKDSKLLSKTNYISSSVIDNLKVKPVSSGLGSVVFSKGLVGGAVSPTVIVTTSAALSASVMSRDSHPVDAKLAVSSSQASGSASCTSGCDTKLSAFASTRGPQMQLPDLGIKMEAERPNLPVIPPAIMAKLQPGPLLTRPELSSVTKTYVESLIMDGNKKLVSGMDTMMTRVGHVQSFATQNTPSMLQRPIMSTSVSMLQTVQHAHSADNLINESGAYNDEKPQDLHSHSGKDSVSSVEQSLPIGAKTSSAGLDLTPSSFKSDVITSTSAVVVNCNDSHVLEAKTAVDRMEFKSTPVPTSFHDGVIKPDLELNKIPNLVSMTDKTAQHHKKGISIMKPMFDRDAELADEIKHLPLPEIPKANIVKSELQVNSAVINMSHKTKNVLNLEKIDANEQQSKLKISASTAISELVTTSVPPITQLSSLTKAVSKDTESTSPGRSASPRNSAIHNPTRTVPDINFYNSSWHPITAPIFPFNLTQSVKKVVGPIPSSDNTKPAKLKMAGTSPPRSTSPRGSKAALHNASHIDSMVKSSIISSHSTSPAVSSVNLSPNVRNDSHGSNNRSVDGGSFHNTSSGKSSPRRSSPKALISTPGNSQPHQLPSLANLTAGVPGLHMLSPQLSSASRTSASNCNPFHSSAPSGFHPSLPSMHQISMMATPSFMANDPKKRNHPVASNSAHVTVSSQASSASHNVITSVPSLPGNATTASTSTTSTTCISTSPTVLNLTTKRKQITSPRRLSPVASIPFSSHGSSSHVAMTNPISSLSQGPVHHHHQSEKVVLSTKCAGPTVELQPPIVQVVPPDINVIKANLYALNEQSVTVERKLINDKANGENPHPLVVPETNIVVVGEPKSTSVPMGLMDHAYVQRMNSDHSSEDGMNKTDQKLNIPKISEAPSSVEPPQRSNNNTVDHALDLVKNDPFSLKLDSDNTTSVTESKQLGSKFETDKDTILLADQIHPAKIIPCNSSDRYSEDNNSDISELSDSQSLTRSLRGRASDRPDSPMLRAPRPARNRRKTPNDDLDAKSDRSESPKLITRGKRRSNQEETDNSSGIDIKRSKMDVNSLPSSDNLNCVDSADDAEVSEMTSRKSRTSRSKLAPKLEEKIAFLHNTRSNDSTKPGGRQSRSSSRGGSECADGDDHITGAILEVPVHGHDTRSRTRTSSRKASDECSSDGGKKCDESRTQNRRNTVNRSRSPVHVKEKSPPRTIREKSPVRGTAVKVQSKIPPVKDKVEPSPAEVPARRTTRSSKPKDNHEPVTSTPAVVTRRRSSREHR